MSIQALPGPHGLAQVRYLRRILADPVPVLDELYAEYGPMVGLGRGPMRMAIVGDPMAVAEMFLMPTSAFRWGHKFNVIGAVVGRSSTIVSDGVDHQRRRRAVTPGFGRRRLNGWIPMIVEETDTAIDAIAAAGLGSGQPIDLYPFGRDLVLRIVVRAMFGESMAACAAEIGDLFQRPQAYLESPAIRQLPHPLPFTVRSRMLADRRRLDAIIDAEIARRRGNLLVEAPDFLSILVESAELSDAEIRDQVVTLIGAGYDSTAASLAWILWCAATSSGVWDRLREEATVAFADAHRGLDHTLLGRLDFANRVMRETLRLHPAGVVAPREAVQDLVVGDYAIPKGTLVLWSAHLSGRNATLWPDPLRFDPGRFASPDELQRQDALRAWIPFGGGLRNCVKFALAQMELTIIAARFAQHLDLLPTRAAVPRPHGMVVNRPVGGVVMHVNRPPNTGRDAGLR